MHGCAQTAASRSPPPRSPHSGHAEGTDLGPRSRQGVLAARGDPSGAPAAPPTWGWERTPGPQASRVPPSTEGRHSPHAHDSRTHQEASRSQPPTPKPHSGLWNKNKDGRPDSRVRRRPRRTRAAPLHPAWAPPRAPAPTLTLTPMV